MSTSPFLAIRTIKKLAEDECINYPRAAEIIKNHLYVDNLITRTDTLEDARTIRNEINALLSRGGFTIRKWASNEDWVIDDLESKCQNTNLVLKGDEFVKTLGIIWDIKNNKIRYSAQTKKITDTITRRKLLSDIAKVFDSLSLLGPVILWAKN